VGQPADLAPKLKFRSFEPVVKSTHKISIVIFVSHNRTMKRSANHVRIVVCAAGVARFERCTLFELQQLHVDARAVDVMTVRGSEIWWQLTSVLLQHGKYSNGLNGVASLFGLFAPKLAVCQHRPTVMAAHETATTTNLVVHLFSSAFESVLYFLQSVRVRMRWRVPVVFYEIAHEKGVFAQPLHWHDQVPSNSKAPCRVTSTSKLRCP